MIYGENTHFTTIRCADQAEWLALRKQGVGGSDVAAIMGLSPWRTPAEVWLEKTGRVEPEDISDRPNVRFGNIMEPVIGNWYREQFPAHRIRRVNAVCRSIARPWAQASLDYEVFDPERGWGVLEIKTARDNRDWKDGAPDYYQTQIVHYMSVTGRAFADVAVFFRESAEFAHYHYDRDDEDVAAVNAAVDAFWSNFVLDDVMPTLVGTEGEAKGLAELYGSFSPEVVRNDEAETLQLISDYQDAAMREKWATADKKKAATLLMGKIGEHKGLVCDTARVTWTRSPAERFDTKRFRADHPNLYQQYASTYTRSGGIRVTDLTK